MGSIEPKNSTIHLDKAVGGSSFSGLGNPFKLAFEQSQTAQCVISLEGRVLALNKSFQNLTELANKQSVLGKRIWHAPCWRSEQGIIIRDLFKESLIESPSQRTLSLAAQGDLPQSYQLSLTCIKDILGNNIVILLELQQRKLERKSNLSDNDGLTSLASEPLLHLQLNEMIEASKHDPSRSFALLAINIDSLHNISNLFGDVIADSFIINIARKFRANTRDGDLVARTREDTFMILLDHLQVTQNALDFAQRCINFLHSECEIGDKQLKIDANIGIVFGDGATHADTLLQQVETALQNAQQSNSHTVVYGVDRLEPIS